MHFSQRGCFSFAWTAWFQGQNRPRDVCMVGGKALFGQTQLAAPADTLGSFGRGGLKMTVTQDPWQSVPKEQALWHGAKGMVVSLARRCPLWHLCYWDIAGSRGQARWWLSRWYFSPKTSSKKRHWCLRALCHLSYPWSASCKLYPAAEGWSACTHCPVKKAAFLRCFPGCQENLTKPNLSDKYSIIVVSNK